MQLTVHDHSWDKSARMSQLVTFIKKNSINTQLPCAHCYCVYHMQLTVHDCPRYQCTDCLSMFYHYRKWCVVHDQYPSAKFVGHIFALQQIIMEHNFSSLKHNCIYIYKKMCSRSRIDLSFIRESVDSLCRDGADAQYMQYLSKSLIISPQTR